MSDKVRERGIIMAADSVRAILDGRKTQTRRVVQYPRSTGAFCRVEMRDGGLWPHVSDDGESFIRQTGPNEGCEQPMACPYGLPGDRLWVRETYWVSCHSAPAYDGDDQYLSRMYKQGPGNVVYVADGRLPPIRGKNDWGHDPADSENQERRGTPDVGGWYWVKRPSVLMPRWASRLTLEITEIRVQRVQEISPLDAIAEGVFTEGVPYRKEPPLPYPVATFKAGWDALNAKHGFPWAANPWVWAITFRVLAARAAEGSDR